MLRLLAILGLVLFVGISINQSFSQEVGLATFQETAQIVVDKTISENVTASITLQSTSIQEMQIPSELEKKIRENDRVIAVILTNEDNCVLGVFDESCIMINVSRDETDKGIIAIQEDARQIGDSLIEEINDFFDTDAEFHSVFIHHRDEVNVALDTSGVVSGRGAVSAVYTMPQESTDSMYEKISAILIPRIIRDSGGFYDTATFLSKDESSKVTFSIIPIDNTSLFQLKVSKVYSGEAQSISQINPLKYLDTSQLKRSEYFSGGFYPLNSVIQTVILSPENMRVSKVSGLEVPTEMIDGELIPTDLTIKGWVFDPKEGEMIQGMYLFGKDTQVTSEELHFTINEINSNDNSVTQQEEFDDSIIVIIIVIVAAGAAAFYLRGYRR